MTSLRVVIVGAGIAGLAAAIALQKHKGIDVQVYDRAAQLQEIGASIALGPNGLRTLERLGVFNALDDEIAFRNKSGFPMIYRHWQTNEIVSVDRHRGEVKPQHRTARYHRAHLQQALLDHVDASRVHLGKAFNGVQNVPGEDHLVITFDDGTSALADVLLGADGINSRVRQAFVPNSRPQWTGWVAFRSVFDASRVAHVDADVLNEANHWWGPDRTFFASRLGKGLFCIVGSWQSDPGDRNAPYNTATWNTEGDVEVLKDFYADWNPAVKQLVDASPYTRLYPNTAASSLDTWVYGDGRITLAGDAAHAHGGAFAAGGSLALDDAWAFAQALFSVYPPGSTRRPAQAELKQALQLYETTRKPHTDRVLSVVHEGNRKKVVDLGRQRTDEELRQSMQSRGDTSWLHEHDVEAALAAASEGPDLIQARL